MNFYEFVLKLVDEHGEIVVFGGVLLFLVIAMMLALLA